MNKKHSELDRFIEKFLTNNIFNKAAEFVEYKFKSLDLGRTADVVKEPEAAILRGIDLQFTQNVKIIEETVSFEVVFSCEIETEQTIRRESEQESVEAWLKLSCSMRITDKLEDFKILSVEDYSRTVNKDKTYRATSDFVPVISRDELDNEATDFLIRWCIEALEKPMPLPIEDIICNKMKLGIEKRYNLSSDFSLFGMLCFNEGEVEVHDLFKEEDICLSIDKPTVFIDPDVVFLRNIGCQNNTLAHEAFHWHRHKVYATIKSMLDGNNHIANKCATEPPKGELWDSMQTDEDWMEWQANWVAPRILMPLRTFKTKAEELIQKHGYKRLDRHRFESMKNVIDELADFYHVSKQSVRIRLIEIGYEDAFHVYNYDEDLPEITYTISPKDAFSEYIHNKSFRQTIDSGMFSYVEGSFVIDHEALIDRSGSEPRLTEVAKKDLARYTLRFVDREAFYFYYYVGHPKAKGAGALFRPNPNIKGRNRYNSFDNDDTVSRAAEITRVAEHIAAQYDSSMDSEKSFCNLIQAKMNAKNWTYKDFIEETLLDQTIFYKIKRNELKNPEIETLIAIFVGLRIKGYDAEHLLGLCGHRLRDTKMDNAYRHILAYSDHGIDYCNSILEEIGVPTLGSQTRE